MKRYIYQRKRKLDKITITYPGELLKGYHTAPVFPSFSTGMVTEPSTAFFQIISQSYIDRLICPKAMNNHYH